MNDEIKYSVKIIPGILKELKSDLTKELSDILSYWLENMIDNEHAGFYGQRLWDETLVPHAAKAAVLNARILWTFSAACRMPFSPNYQQAAKRAFDYFLAHFIDGVHGGVYWSVDFKGEALDTKKQVYAQSFAIYALSEYFLFTSDEQAKLQAIHLFELLEKYSRDQQNGGYIEAFSRTWDEIDDLRLSEKDANEKKTMNTHLHVLEGYTNLYRIYPAAKVKEAIAHLLEMFMTHIIEVKTNHLVLFFDEDWNRKGSQISFGHDIEAAWLLAEAAEVIADEYWVDKMNAYGVKIVDAAKEGLDADFGLWQEFDAETGHWIKEKHWWPQAEAMVGFLHAWQLTSNDLYLDNLLHSWHFIQNNLRDADAGEWIWGVKEDGSLIKTEDKAGFWKCPYHNGRACMEIIKRIDEIAM